MRKRDNEQMRKFYRNTIKTKNFKYSEINDKLQNKTISNRTDLKT